jgi:ABC-type multidrug transport system fused ATPase/permease subunit
MEMFVSQFNFFEKCYVAIKRASVQSARMFHFYDLHAASLESSYDSQKPIAVSPQTSPKVRAAPASVECPLLEFSHVSFSYPKSTLESEEAPGPVVLSDVSFTVQRQSLTALLGASGSGKSSVGKLLLQFYMPASGAVYLDGTVCRDANSARRVRDTVAWVDQVIVAMSVCFRRKRNSCVNNRVAAF